MPHAYTFIILITDYYKRGLPTVEFSVAVCIEDIFMRKHSISLAMAHHQQQQQHIHEPLFLLFLCFFVNEKISSTCDKNRFFSTFNYFRKIKWKHFLYILFYFEWDERRKICIWRFCLCIELAICFFPKNSYNGMGFVLWSLNTLCIILPNHLNKFNSKCEIYYNYAN